MSPLYMETGYEPNSPGSLSAEESNSNNAGSEREGEGQQGGIRVTKRQEKNRNAARKSRKKQTERADELHEELQSLEQSNSALKKEIASLRKDLHLYTTALESHEPICRLKASASNSTTFLSVSPSADSQTGPPQASGSTQATAPSLSTSLTSSFGLQTLDRIESPHLSSSTPAPTVTSLDPPTNLSAQLFTSSSSLPFSTVSSPHSLFSKDPPSLITSRKTEAAPVCTSLISSPVLPSSLTTAALTQSGQGTINESSSVSANACFSTRHPCALDASIVKQASFLSPTSHIVPPYSPENTGQAGQGFPMNMPQHHPGSFRAKPVNSSPRFFLSPSTVQDPAVQLLQVTPQTNLEPSLASASALKPSSTGHITPSSTSLLSLLTNPSPLSVSQTTSSSFEAPLPHTPLPLQTVGDPSMDLFLCELLEGNEWILQ
uniref:basic leucine zipper transcriptional factor ATF-like 2 n=1 Tax=Semicossyphus pulcher TaxID=241346 RepID=UPI0037E7E362